MISTFLGCDEFELPFYHLCFICFLLLIDYSHPQKIINQIMKSQSEIKGIMREEEAHCPFSPTGTTKQVGNYTSKQHMPY